jgi:hypothetical protein
MAVAALCDVILPHLPNLSWLDGTDRTACIRQLPVLAACAALYGLLTLLSCRRSVKRYEAVDL